MCHGEPSRTLAFGLIDTLLILASMGIAFGHGVLSYPHQRGALTNFSRFIRTPFNNSAPVDYHMHFPAGNKSAVIGAGYESQKAQNVQWHPFEPLKQNYRWRYGVCGDLKNVNHHLKGGIFYNQGTPVATFKQGGIMDAGLTIVSHHNGFIEFHVCDVQHCPGRMMSESCFRSGHCYQLQRALNSECDSGGHEQCGPIDPYNPGRWYLPCSKHKITERNLDWYGKGSGLPKTILYQLPDHLSCDHCVLQWFWSSANSCNPPGVIRYHTGPHRPERWRPCNGQGGAVKGFTMKQKTCNETIFPEEYVQCSDIRILPTGWTPEWEEKKNVSDDLPDNYWHGKNRSRGGNSHTDSYQAIATPGPSSSTSPFDHSTNEIGIDSQVSYPSNDVLGTDFFDNVTASAPTITFSRSEGPVVISREPFEIEDDIAVPTSQYSQLPYPYPTADYYRSPKSTDVRKISKTPTKTLSGPTEIPPIQSTTEPSPFITGSPMDEGQSPETYPKNSIQYQYDMHNGDCGQYYVKRSGERPQSSKEEALPSSEEDDDTIMKQHSGIFPSVAPSPDMGPSEPDSWRSDTGFGKYNTTQKRRQGWRAITDIVLFADGERIVSLNEVSTVNISRFENVTIEAITDSTVEHTTFVHHDNFFVDEKAPFYLFGDSENGVHYWNGTIPDEEFLLVVFAAEDRDRVTIRLHR